MAIVSFPFPSVTGDRKTTAAQEAAGRAILAASGVVPDVSTAFECSKVAGTLNVSVAVGEAVVAGHPVIMDAAQTVALGAGHASYSRIDIVCLESNANTGVRASRLVVVAGTPAASPVAPTLTQTATQYQLPLAQVTVPAAATTLNSATLVDARVMMRGRHMHDTADLNDAAVTAAKIGTGAVTTTKLGTITEITMATGDKIIYDDTTGEFRLSVSGCTVVQLCPIVYGTSATPPAGTYPKGTVYMTHTA